jgi:PEP-CTERM motif
MKKFTLFLLVILAAPWCMHAQDLLFTDSVAFQSPTQPNLQMTFYAQFVFDPLTNQIVPGTMTYSTEDPFGLGPFTAPSNGPDAFFNFIGPDNTWIQIGNNFGTQPWPQTGTYGSLDTALLCGVNGGSVSTACQNGFAGFGFTAANSGTLTIQNDPAETPEPSTLVLLAAGGLLFGLIELIRRRA